MAFPDMWSQKCLISLQKQAGTEIGFQTVISSVDFDDGDKDITEQPNTAGGRIVKFEPQTLTTVTFEAYPVGIATDQDTDLGFSQQFNGLDGTQTIWDTSQPLSTNPTIYRDKFQLVVMWTTDPAITLAMAAQTQTNYQMYRWIGKNAYITSVKKAFTDNGLKFTVVCKVPIFAKDASKNITEEESDGSTTWSAVTAFT